MAFEMLFAFAAIACQPLADDPAPPPSLAREFTDWNMDSKYPRTCTPDCPEGDWSCRADRLVCGVSATGERMAAVAIEAALRQALAISDVGAEAIPGPMEEALAPFFDQDLLGRVRYRVGFPNGISLLGLQRHLRAASAMAFGHVIVFANAVGADDVCLWAHELEHVKQYYHFGIDGFARLYAMDHRSLETPASEQQNYVCGLVRQSSRTAPGGWPTTWISPNPN
jgi:hypothetical protein